MITHVIMLGLIDGASALEVVASPGGGALFIPRRGVIERTYDLPQLSQDVELAIAALARPKSRAKRKKMAMQITGEMRALVARAKGYDGRLPYALLDLPDVMAQLPDVEAGQISFAEYRAMIADRLDQARREIETRMLMQEEEEAAMFMLTMH